MTPSELSRRRLKLYVSDPPEIQDGELPKVPKDSAETDPEAVEPPPASDSPEVKDASDSSDSEKTLELGA